MCKLLRQGAMASDGIQAALKLENELVEQASRFYINYLWMKDLDTQEGPHA